jgi:hypothetical protein
MGRTETGLLMGARGSTEERTIQISASEESSRAGKGRLILYGFDSAQLNELGLPSENGQPSLVWVNPKKTRRWPVTVTVPLPSDPRLRLLPVLDIDGDGRLGDGDHLGHALSLDEATGDQGQLKLRIEGKLPARGDGPPQGGPPGDPGPGPGTPSGTAGESPFLGESGSGDGSKLPGANLDVATSPKLEVRISGGQGKQLPRDGLLLFYVYRTETLNDLGMPQQDSQPIFLWTTELTDAVWPVTLEIPDPIAALEGMAQEDLSLVVGFDLDRSGLLSEGDRVSAAVSRSNPKGLSFELTAELTTGPAEVRLREGPPVASSPELPFPSTAPPEGSGCNLASRRSQL